MKLKLFPALIIFIFTAALASGEISGWSVEASYMPETMEMMIIREAAKAGSREQKLMALEYIAIVIGRDGSNEEIRTILESLSIEGTRNRVILNRRVINDFPDIRQQAVKYLGVIGTPEAETAIVRMLTIEQDPMVLQEAVKALGSITSENYEIMTDAIIRVAVRNNNLRTPDNIIAFSVVEALGNITEKNGGMVNSSVRQLLTTIIDGNYTALVKEQARQILTGE